MAHQKIKFYFNKNLAKFNNTSIIIIILLIYLIFPIKSTNNIPENIIEIISSSKFIKKFSMSNKNIFSIYDKGIYIYNPFQDKIITNFKLKQKNYITSLNESSSINIAQYPKEYNSNIICLIKKDIFIFDSKGNFLYNNENSNINFFSPYNLIPTYIDNYNFYYIVSYINNNSIPTFIYFKFDSESNNNIIINQTKLYNYNNIDKNKFFCNINYHSLTPNELNCIYQNINSNNQNTLTLNITNKKFNIIQKLNIKRKTDSYIEKCLTYNSTSISQNLCLTCNTEKGYFRIITNTTNNNSPYIDCYNLLSIPSNFFFNTEISAYELCYETCKTCKSKGDPYKHNCTSCANNYIFRPFIDGTTNCVTNCKYFYYYTSYGQYKCSQNFQCPEESKLIIKEKNMCTDNCTKDNLYKYQYNGRCYKNCPNNTIENNFLCEDENINKCTLSESELDLKEFLSGGGMETNAKNYAIEFSYTKNHVSIYINTGYVIIFYKNENCLKELQLNYSYIDFGSCFNKSKQYYKIDEDLIISIISKVRINSNPITSYALYNPLTGEKLKNEEVCKDDDITVSKNVLNVINDTETVVKLAEQEINIFNISDKFFNDICKSFKSPSGKDATLKDRVFAYYSNIALCDNDCENNGVNLTTMLSECVCKYKDDTLYTELLLLDDNNTINDTIKILWNSTSKNSFIILKCFKYVFQNNNFFKCVGGLIVIIFMIIQIACVIHFYIKGLFGIKKYIFNLTETYINFLNLTNNNIENASPVKKIRQAIRSKHLNSSSPKNKAKNKTKDNNNNTKQKKRNSTIDAMKDKSNKNIKDFDKKNIFKKARNSINVNLSINKLNISNKIIKKIKKNEEGLESSKSQNFLRKTKNNISLNNHIKNNKNIKNIKNNNIDIEKYLLTPYEDMFFSEAIEKDKRTICDYFIVKVKENQMIVNAFCLNEKLIPITIKIIFITINIICCFFVNGMLYNEQYISKVFNSDEDENFLSCLPRSVEKIIITTVLSIIFKYLLEYFYTDDKLVRSIYLHRKNDQDMIKMEILNLIKRIQIKYTLFIISSVLVTFFSWIYISSFNVVYPYTTIEWFTTSVLIIFLSQVFPIVLAFCFMFIRQIGLEIKSEKLFKFSQIY